MNDNERMKLAKHKNTQLLLLQKTFGIDGTSHCSTSVGV